MHLSSCKNATVLQDRKNATVLQDHRNATVLQDCKNAKCVLALIVMELNGAALNINKPCVTSRKTFDHREMDCYY